MAENRPLSYREVLNLYEGSQAAGDPRDLKSFSQDLNTLYKTDVFSEGLRDNPWTRFSTKLDRAMEESLAGQTLGAIGGAVGGIIGYKDVGKQIGQELPRQMLNAAPLFIPGVGLIPAALGTGALQGADVLAKTGKPQAAAIAGVTGAALPFIGKAGGQAALRAVGAPKVAGVVTELGAEATGKAPGAVFSGRIPVGRAQVAAEFLGSEAAMTTAEAASNYAQDPDTPILSKDFAAQLVLGELPFSVFDVMRVAKTPRVQQVETLVRPEPLAKPQPAQPKAPKKGSDEEIRMLDEYLSKFEQTIANPDASPEEKSATFAQLEKITQEKPKDQYVVVKGRVNPEGDRVWADAIGDQPTVGTYWINDPEAGLEVLKSDPTDLSVEIKIRADKLKKAKFEIDALAPKMQTQQTVELPQRAEGVEPTKIGAPEMVAKPVSDATRTLLEMDESMWPKALTPAVRKAAQETGVSVSEGANAAEILQSARTEAQIAPPEKVSTESADTLQKMSVEPSPKAPTKDLNKVAADYRDATARDRVEQEKAKTPIDDPLNLNLLKENKEVRDAATEFIKNGVPAEQALSAAIRLYRVREIDSAKKDAAKARYKATKYDTRERAKPVGSEIQSPDGGFFKTKAEAEQYLQQYAEAQGIDVEELASVNKGRNWNVLDAQGNILRTYTRKDSAEKSLRKGEVARKGEERGWVLRKVVRKQTLSEEAHGAIADPSAQIPGEAVPTDMNQQDLIETARRAERDLETFMEVAADNYGNPYFVSTDEARNAMGELMKGFAGLPSDQEMSTKALKGLVQWQMMEDSKGYGLEALSADDLVYGPFDADVVAEMQLKDRGALGWLDWWIAQDVQDVPGLDLPQGIIAELRRLYPKVEVNTALHKAGGFSYSHGDNTLRITLPRNRDDAIRKGLTVGHEFVHAVTLQAWNKGDAAALEFRSRLEDQMHDILANSTVLVPELRGAIQKLRSSNWYDKRARTFDIEERRALDKEFISIVDKKGATHIENKQRHEVAYALLNVDEFVAQAFSSENFVRMLMQTPGRKTTQTVWSKFVQAVKNLLGLDAPDSAWDQLLTNFQDFERNRASKEYNTVSYVRDYLKYKYGEASFPNANEVGTRVNTYFQSGKIGDLLEGRYKVVGETLDSLDLPELKSLFSQMTHEQLLKLLPGLTDLQFSLGLVEAVNGQVRKGNLATNIRISEGQTFINQRKITALKDAIWRDENAYKQWTNLNNFVSDGWLGAVEGRMQGDTPPEVSAPPADLPFLQAQVGLRDKAEVQRETSKERLEGRGTFSGVGGWIDKNFMLTQFVARKIPAFRSIYNAVRTGVGLAFERISQLNTAYHWDPVQGKISREVMRNNQHVETDPYLNRKMSDIRLTLNELEKQGILVGATPQQAWSDPQIQQHLRGVSPENRKALRGQFDSAMARRNHWTEKTLPQFFEKYDPITTAKVIAAREGITPDSALELASALHQVLRGARTDPMNAAAYIAQLRTIASQMSPATATSAIQLANDSITRADEFLQFNRQRSSYVSEQRYDAHHAVLFDANGNNVRIQAPTIGELNEKVKRYVANGAQLAFVVEKSDTSAPPGGLQRSVLTMIDELDAQEYNRIATALQGVDPAIREIALQGTQRGSALRAALEANKPLPGTARKFVAGREDIDMLQNDNLFYNRANNWMRHKLARAENELYSLDPEIAGNAELRRYANQYVDNFLTPDNPIARRIMEATYFYKLGFDLGNASLESVQSLTTGMQAVISETGSVTDAFGLMGKAAKAVAGFARNKKWSDPEHKWLYEQMLRTGEINMTTWNDVYDPDMLLFEESTRAKTTAGRVIENLHVGARKFSTLFQRWNNLLGMFSGYELARQKGLSQEDAFIYARDLKDRGTYTGGKAQRSVGLWSIKSKAVPQLLSSLQTYSTGWFSQMKLDWEAGFGKNKPAGLTATQVAGAKKAFVYGIAVQAVLAGALGLPGVGQGIALLEQATGFDLKGWIRQNLSNLFGQDQEDGGMITALAMNGVLAYATPFDPSSRASIGIPYIGVDPYSGFSFERLAGATVATGKDIQEGLFAVAKGDRVGWEKILPNVLKRPARLLMDEGDIRTPEGTLIHKLTPTERAMMIGGLTPSAVQRKRDISTAARKSSDMAQAEYENLINSLARTFRKSGPDATIMRIQDQIKGLEPQQALFEVNRIRKSVANRVRAQSQEYDWRRDVNVGADLTGLQNFRPSNIAQGRQLEQSVLASLGGRTRPNLRADRNAQMIDYLLNTGSARSAAEARMLLQTRRPAPDLYGLPYTPAFQ